MGGTDRFKTPISVLLTHGDVVVLSAPSRTAYHAVPRILDMSTTLCDHVVLDNGVENTELNDNGCEHVVKRALTRRVVPWEDTAVAGQLDKQFPYVDREFVTRTRINVSIRQVQKECLDPF